MVSITKESMCCCSNALQGVEEKISNLGLSNITLRVQGSATPVYTEHCDVWIYWLTPSKRCIFENAKYAVINPSVYLPSPSPDSSNMFKVYS